MIRLLKGWDYQDSSENAETKELLLAWGNEALGTILLKLQVLG